MEKVRFTIPIYDYEVIYIQVTSKDDYPKVVPFLRELDITEEHKNEVKDTIESEGVNGGDTFRNLPIRKLLVIIYPCISDVKRRNIVAHESRHVVDRICEHCNIQDTEAAGYLAGFLAEKIY